MRMIEMDPSTTLGAQMEHDAGPIVLLNVFTVAPHEADALVEAWAADAALMQRQPGFVSAQFHRGVGGSAFLNYAEWATLADFRRAFANPEFQAGLRRYPPSTVASPHVFRKVAVPGICGDSDASN